MIQSLLRSVTFFDGLTDAQLAELTRVGGTEKVAANHTVFSEGDAANRLYVILAGGVRVTRQEGDGEPIELTRLNAGSFFGELALFDGGARSATVSTLDDSEFFVLGRDAFIQILTGSPGLLEDVLAGLSGKIRGANEKLQREWNDKRMLRAEMDIQRHRAVAEMVAGVAHEINTPLGIVRTAASLILEQLAPDARAALAKDPAAALALTDVAEACRLIDANIERANRLIRTFKSLSVHHVTEARESVALPQLVREILDLCRINVRRARLTIDLQNRIPPGQDEWTGYPGYLSQVLLNLLANVERYAYPTGAGGSVEVIVAPGVDENFAITVRDFGVGISSDHLPKIFDAFFTTGRSIGGTGLGLAIVYTLVKSAMHGSIRAESEPGKGAAFHIVLPREVPEPTDN